MPFPSPSRRRKNLTTIYTFCAQNNSCPDGAAPGAGLVQAIDGNLYGTTEGGGANGNGTIFKVTLTGQLTTLHSFNLNDGIGSTAPLIQASDGNFYGTSEVGGPHAGGTVYKITPSGALTVLYYFCPQGSPCTDGASPLGSVTQGSDGNFYGTTVTGGAFDMGTVFKLSPAGELTMVSFKTLGGNYPYASLLQATNGIFYGSTYAGGDSEAGTLFTISTGLHSFVEAEPGFDHEGAKIAILGQGFSPSSIVKFGGVQASSVTPHEGTALIALVPDGALTGPLTVTTGDSTLTSNQPFRVLPRLVSFNPPSGPVGQTVTITGTGLTQTLKVFFGGLQATNLKVASDTQVTADVPTGAKTNRIAIETKGGIAQSKADFTVTE